MWRLFKYLSAFSSLFIVLILALILSILYTQWGFRTALVLAKQVLPELSYESVNGTISGGAEIDNLIYDAGTKVVVDKVYYNVERASIFEQFLSLSALELTGVDVYLAEAQEQQPESEGFQGFESPVSLDLKNIKVIDLAIYPADFDAKTNNQALQKIDSIAGHLTLEKDQLNLSQIDIKQVDNFVKGDGRLTLSSSLPYDFDVQLGYKAGDIMLKSQGDIVGSLAKVNLNQQLTINSPQFSGQGVLAGDVGLADSIDLNLKLNADDFSVKVSEQDSLTLNNLVAVLTGSPEAYQLNSQLMIDGFVEQPSSLSFESHGNSKEIHFDSITLKNQAALLAGKANVNWSDGISADSQLKLEQFDIAMVMPDYQSSIDGELELLAKVADGGYKVNIPAFAFDGTLNQFPFELEGQLDAMPDAVHAPGLSLGLGNNTLTSNVSLVNQVLDAQGKLRFQSIKDILPEASGQLSGEFSVTGALSQPNLTVDMSGNKIAYNDIRVGSFTAKAKTNIDTLDARITAKSINASGNEIKQTVLNITGKPEQHTIKWSANHSEADISLLAKGGWNAAEQVWSGSILDNAINIISVKEILALQAPMAVTADIRQKNVSLESACWKMQSGKADFCTQAAIDYGNNRHDINLDIKQLDAMLATPYLPENMALKGQLVGKLDALMNNAQWQAESQFAMQNGDLKVMAKGLEKPIIDSPIEQLTIDFKGQQNQADVAVDFKLDNSNFVSVNLRGDLLDNKQADWQLQGDILGQWNKPELFAELTPELVEATGQFNLKGAIAGSLDNPSVDLLLDNPDGYFLPARTGTKIEALALAVKAANQKANIALSADSGGGSLALTSDIKYAIESKDKWSLSGKLKGDGFEFIDIPELKLFASPDLVIEANQFELDVKGELIIPTATVTVEKIPSSARMPSKDIVIHQAEGEQAQKQGYQVSYDIKVSLPEGIDLSVLDFEGVAKGELSLRSSKEDQSSILAFGALTIQDGTYSALGQKLDVNNSEVVFSGLVDNPNLKIYATRTSLDGRVLAGLQISGTPNSLLTELYSDPELPDAEVLSYISTGRGLEDSDSAISNQQLLQMAILMGVDRAATAFPGLTSAAGIDRVRVNEANNSADSSVELGKNLTDDIYLGYDYGLFNRLGFWVLEYQLSQALSLESRYGKSKSVDLNYNISVE